MEGVVCKTTNSWPEAIFSWRLTLILVIWYCATQTSTKDTWGIDMIYHHFSHRAAFTTPSQEPPLSFQWFHPKKLYMIIAYLVPTWYFVWMHFQNLINTAKSQKCYEIYQLPGLQKNVAPGNYGCAFAFLATPLYLNAVKHHKNQQELAALLIKRSKSDTKVCGPNVGRQLWSLDWTRWLEIVMNHTDCPFKFQNRHTFDEMQKLYENNVKILFLFKWSHRPSHRWC